MIVTKGDDLHWRAPWPGLRTELAEEQALSFNEGDQESHQATAEHAE